MQIVPDFMCVQPSYEMQKHRYIRPGLLSEIARWTFYVNLASQHRNAMELISNSTSSAITICYVGDQKLRRNKDDTSGPMLTGCATTNALLLRPCLVLILVIAVIQTINSLRKISWSFMNFQNLCVYASCLSLSISKLP
jgi:hypothetical protein